MVALGCSSGGSPNASKPDAGGAAGSDDGGGTSGSGGNGSGGNADAGDRDSGAPSGAPDSGPAMQTCGDAKCAAVAKCDDSAAKPKCTCPSGYRDVNRDGSRCDDIDECASAAANDCADHASCKNKPGGYECKCDAPAYSGNGKVCDCATGYKKVSGKCVAKNGTDCSDDANCTSGHCVGGTCCASACDAPPLCKVEDGASCADGKTCKYKNDDNGTDCSDDSACTVNDACQDGACTGATKNCSDGNICTSDSCDPSSGCKHDGTGITTTGCSSSMCGVNWHCAGDEAGSCDADSYTDCTGSDTPCGVGTCDPANGNCSTVPLDVDTACDDGDACTTGEKCNGSATCTGGTDTSASCNDNNPCTDDTCNPIGGCANAINTVACDDGNPCTQNDHCFGGQCNDSTPKDCSSQNDNCHLGVCNVSNGNCDKSPRTNGTTCDDLSSCSLSSSCQTGTCTPTSAFDACGAHATGCTPGSPNVCGCASGYHNSTGTCVPDGDECGSNPCDVNATCTDPNGSVSNDYVCTCKAGYMGNGMPRNLLTCTNINECASSPCGAGTCSENAPGQGYTCSCNGGYTQVAGQCVCDLEGTFEVKINMAISWSGVAGIQNGTNVPSYTWAIQEATYDSNGQLVITTTPCGGVTPDLCGSGISILGIAQEAYAQYFPNQIWGGQFMPTQTLTMQIPDARPTHAFQSSDSAVLLGIRLVHPDGTDFSLGPWPTARAQVGDSENNKVCFTSGGMMQCAFQHDDDNDSPAHKPGVTSYIVPPGGVSADNMGVDDPPQNYGATSSRCKTTGMNPTPEPYAYFPGGISTGGEPRASRFYMGSRTISRFDGTITSCDRIEGSVKGPASSNTRVQLNARFLGCMDDSADQNCDAAGTDFFDTQSQTQQVTSATFVMKRWTSATPITCAAVRADTF